MDETLHIQSSIDAQLRREGLRAITRSPLISQYISGHTQAYSQDKQFLDTVSLVQYHGPNFQSGFALENMRMAPAPHGCGIFETVVDFVVVEVSSD
jgi:hypothetical protein